MTAAFLVLLLNTLWFFFSACGDSNEIEENLPPQGNQEYHVQYGESGGYANCFVCHPKVKLHLVSSNPYLDLDFIQELVEQQGMASCSICHYDDN